MPWSFIASKSLPTDAEEEQRMARDSHANGDLELCKGGYM
jgi:hypothetical protein